MDWNRRTVSGNTISALALALILWLPCAAAFAQQGSPGLVPAGYGGGGRFTALAVDPSDPSRLVIGSDVAGYYIPAPDGNGFALRGKELAGLAVSSLTFNPAKPGVLAVQCDLGLYVSRDGGKTLTPLSDKLGYNNRFFGSRLLIFNGPALTVATDAKGVFSVKWEAPGQPETPVPGLEGVKVNSLAMFDNALFAATEKGVFKVKDGRFVPADSGLPPGKPVADLAADPKSGMFCVLKSEGLYRFDAAKAAWAKPGAAPAPAKPSNQPLAYKTLGLDPAKPGRVLMATDPSYWPITLFISDDAGASWKTAENFALAGDAPPNWAKGLQSVEAIAFSPNGDTLYVSDWWNVWKSTDSGEHFTQIHKGLQNTVVNGLAAHPDKPELILMATADNGVMRSTDGGATWARSMSGVADGDAMAVRFAPQNPSKAYFLFYPWEKPAEGPTVPVHLCKSTDAGATWTTLTFTIAARKLPPQSDGKPSALRIDPRDEDTVYVGTNGHGLFRVNTKLLAEGKSREAVENLSTYLPMPNLPNADSLLVAADNPNKLYVSTVGGGVWTSENAGRTWLPASPRWTYAFGLAADPARPGRVFAAVSDKRLIATEDAGRTWKEIVLPGERPNYVPTQVVAFDPSKPEVVYAGTSAYDLKAADGLFVSRDGGKTFAPVASDLPRANVLCLAPAAGSVLAGFNGLGVFRLVDRP